MEQLIPVIRFEVWAVLGFLTLVIGINILTGAIKMRGLIVDKATGRLSPGSAQSAVLAVMSAAVT